MLNTTHIFGSTMWIQEGENLRNLESDHKNWFPLPQKGKCNQQLLFKAGNVKHSQRYSYYLMCDDVHGMVKY